MKRRNREMKKVRSFIRKRVAKNEFESYYLKHYEEIAWQAEKVTEQIERSGCQNLYERSIRERKMLHGDYNYHNLIMLRDDIAVTVRRGKGVHCTPPFLSGKVLEDSKCLFQIK